MKIQKFDRNNLNEMKDDLKQALEPFEKKWGVVAQMTKTRYADLQTHITLRLTIGESDDAVRRQTFERFGPALGVPVDWYGERIRLDKGIFIISELIPSRPKNCIGLTRIIDDRHFVCSPEAIRRGAKFYP